MASERCWWTKKKEKRKMGREAAHHPPKKLRRKREQRREEREAPDICPLAPPQQLPYYDVNSRDTTKKPASHKIIFASIDIDHQLIVTAPFITTKNQQ